MEAWQAARLELGAAALLLLSCIGPARAQEKQPVEAKIDIRKLMIVDGPYELQGSTGIYGFVVARSGGKATFRPCTGPMIDVDDNRLKRTKSTCADEPPTDGNPFSVGCGGGVEVPSQVKAAIAKEGPTSALGTIFEMRSTTDVQVYATYDDTAASKIKGIDRMATCGNWNIGFDASGTDIMHFLSKDDATMGNYGDVKQ
ncbi:hypothetical protein [Rhizobium sp. SG741]|uniref:hypothetical protein n=1 Tax=Rhizobium sp. SG741 TaxID=2587114 RepID=UPI0014458DD0|nr:hypothetical protein [Rhizobium sp. SG741]NKJ03778.1 hypothetical protein [Rhizobium sp. SG741]